MRLVAESYAQTANVCSVTVAVKARRPVFVKAELATAALDTLRHLADEHDVPVYAYCIMPDHVHMVLSPSNTCDIITFVGRFKNLVLRTTWTHEEMGSFWQRSFWDHFVRDDQDLRQLVDYVLANPVRAGLVQEWSQYPYSGSLAHLP